MCGKIKELKREYIDKTWLEYEKIIYNHVLFCDKCHSHGVFIDFPFLVVKTYFKKMIPVNAPWSSAYQFNSLGQVNYLSDMTQTPMSIKQIHEFIDMLEEKAEPDTGSD